MWIAPDEIRGQEKIIQQLRRSWININEEKEYDYKLSFIGIFDAALTARAISFFSERFGQTKIWFFAYHKICFQLLDFSIESW